VSDTTEDEYMYDAGSKNIPAVKKKFKSKSSALGGDKGQTIKQP
jgi:hypothetical protein